MVVSVLIWNGADTEVHKTEEDPLLNWLICIIEAGPDSCNWLSKYKTEEDHLIIWNVAALLNCKDTCAPLIN